MTAFAELGVRSRTLRSLERASITQPLQVQEDSLPPLLAGKDLVMEAPTGSGKTLAFLIPLVERLAGPRPGGPRALIVAPTRELATQITAVLRSTDAALRAALLYGGIGYGAQNAALGSHPDVVVGCPGRILDLAGQGRVSFAAVEYLVLDEADEMLDQGFARDVERIIAMCSRPARQTVLASATMPDWVQRMIDRHLTAPVRVRVLADAEPDLEHGIMAVPREQRVDTLSSLLRRHPTSAIVFHRTKHGAKKLARDLAARGHRSAELQGNLSQNARDRAIDSFRHGTTDVLVATNVAARGLDISHVGLVVNYELPDTPQWLTHRIGRTARNGAAGRAITVLSEDDADQWRKLRRLGAPALPQVDGAHLLATGEMRYLPGEPAFLHAAHRPAARNERRPASGQRPMNTQRPASGQRPMNTPRSANGQRPMNSQRPVNRGGRRSWKPVTPSTRSDETTARA